jgi:transcriptional regulator with PAS, ATPase and Fis domain
MEDALCTQFGNNIFEEVMNALADGVIVIDRDLTILFQNEAIKRQFGTKIGGKCYKAFRGRSEPCPSCTVLNVIKDGKPRTGITDAILPDGQVVWVEYSSAPLKDSEGNIIAAVETAHDITEKIRLNEECCTLRREIIRQAQFENIITQSKKMKSIFSLVERIAATTSTVLITGESGTGKELIAKAIFANSDRREKPFISLNCAAIPENLLESELFGHVRGAFTGATKDHMGLLEAADTGTLFLDEVGEIPLHLQVKFLRFLQEGEARRVGDTRSRKLDVRIISATNKELENVVKQGAFREDLYFRLNVIPITLPPLRERKEDIPLLAAHFLERLCDVHKRNVRGISSSSLKKLMDYSWPGNVRELENAIEYALHVTDERRSIQEVQLPPAIRGLPGAVQRHDQILSVDGYVQNMILALQADHTEEQIARILGISRKNLWEKRKRWDLKRPFRVD